MNDVGRAQAIKYALETRRKGGWQANPHGYLIPGAIVRRVDTVSAVKKLDKNHDLNDQLIS